MKFIHYNEILPVNLALVESFYCQDTEDKGKTEYKIVFQLISGNIVLWKFEHEGERKPVYENILISYSKEVITD